MKLSIIIPTLNEAEVLGQAIESLEPKPDEIIVVDGGSKDATIEVASQHTSHVVSSRTSRGFQQDVGARRAKGEVLLFLHADTRLPRKYGYLIEQTLATPSVVFGAFRLSIQPSEPALDLVSLMANLRSRFLGLPYGDQALFVLRRAYFEVGGFRDWPVMEDVDLVRRLNRVGGFKMARGCVQTSARRWQKENLWFTTLRNWSLIFRYFMGVSPHSLARYYPNTR
jgi:rSAM/selenodomain-associated transferase 2